MDNSTPKQTISRTGLQSLDNKANEYEARFGRDMIQDAMQLLGMNDIEEVSEVHPEIFDVLSQITPGDVRTTYYLGNLRQKKPTEKENMPTKEEIAFFEERAKDYQEKFGRNYKADTIIAFLATEFRTALQNDKRISRFFKALTKQENDVLRTLRTAQDAV